MTATAYLKKNIVFFCILFPSILVNNAISAERWWCNLSMDQFNDSFYVADALEFTLSDTAIEGNISGRWVGDLIEFQRLNLKYKGVALQIENNTADRAINLRTNSPTVRMAGRFADGYRGIWSADCRPAAKVYRSTMLQGLMADLDEGVITRDATADILFETRFIPNTEPPQNRALYIVPQNHALIGTAGSIPVGRAECHELELTEQDISLDDISDNTYFCVRTNGGRYSRFTVQRGQRHPKVSFTTWERL